MADPAFYRSRSLWLDSLDDDPLTPRAALPRGPRRRRGHRGCRLHGPVDRLLPPRGRPVAADRGGGARHRRLRRLGPQRGLVLGPAPDGARGDGRDVTGGTPRSPCRRRCTTPSTRWAASPSGRASTATTPRAATSRWPRRPSTCRGCGHSSTRPGPSASATTTSGGWTGARPRALVGADGVLGALHHRHCAAIQPARLARGLADVVERRGVTIYESTPVTSIEPGDRPHRPRRGAGRCGGAGDRGLHPAAPWREAHPGAGLLPDGGHRAAARRALGRAGHGRRGRRSTTPDTSSSTASAPPTGGSPSVVGARRTTSARTSTPPSTATRRSSPSCARSSARCSRRCTTSSSRTPGVARSASRATGTARSASIGRPAWPGPAATSVTASPPPTWPAAPSPS